MGVKRIVIGTLVTVARLVVALTFMFSGLVKVIDPKGFEYKLIDYGRAFGLDALLHYRLPLLAGLALATTEFLLGVSTLFGISRRGTSRFLLAFMTVMTALTLYLALKNPVSDCGCFGDALVLTNWQTFSKNVVLLVCTLVLCFGHRYVVRLISVHTHWMVTIYGLIFALSVASYALVRLPLVDFRPFHIGANLSEEPQFTTTFTLEKGGERREFTEADYPYDDTTWVYVESHTTQTGENHEFEMTDTETGRDISREVVARRGYTFLVVFPDLPTADNSTMDRLNHLYDYAQGHNIKMYALADLSASGDTLRRQWCDMTGAEYPFYQCDQLVLKTMVRSNPGLLLLEDGRVVGKWASTNLPTAPPTPQGGEGVKARGSRADTPSTLWGVGGAFFIPVAFLLMLDRITAALAYIIRHIIRLYHKPQKQRKQDEKENRSRQLEDEQEPAGGHRPRH